MALKLNKLENVAIAFCRLYGCPCCGHKSLYALSRERQHNAFSFYCKQCFTRWGHACILRCRERTGYSCVNCKFYERTW